MSIIKPKIFDMMYKNISRNLHFTNNLLQNKKTEIKGARMIDISNKEETDRNAIAEATVNLPIKILEAIREKKVKKGDVLSVSEVAGIMGAKRTSEILPLCHPIRLTGVSIDMKMDFEKSCILIQALVKTSKQKTGVEMEALVAACIAALNVYDMCKYFTHDITITNVRLIEKTGGKSDFKNLRKEL